MKKHTQNTEGNHLVVLLLVLVHVLLLDPDLVLQSAESQHLVLPTVEEDPILPNVEEDLNAILSSLVKREAENLAKEARNLAHG